VEDKAEFRPGMTVSAEIETKYRTNVLSVPIGCVTTRPPKPGGTNNVSTNALASTNAAPITNATAVAASPDKKTNAPPPVVVFVVEGDHVNTTPIKLGISDDNYYEITDGLKEGDEIVSGSYKAIKSLEDGKKILKGGSISEAKK